MIFRIIILIQPVFLISQIELTVTTSQPEYEAGENIEIIASSINTTDEPVVIQSSSGCLSIYEIDGLSYMGCDGALTNYEFAPNETIIETFILSQEDYPLESGVHTVSAFIQYWGIGSSPDDMEYFDEMIVLTASNLFEIIETDFDITLTFDCPEDVELGSEGNILPVNVDVTEDVWGYLLNISIENDLIEITNVISDELQELYFIWSIIEDNLLQISCLPLDEVCIFPGQGTLLLIEFNVYESVGDSIEFIFSNSSIFSDGSGIPINYSISDTCTFSLVDSYCNPGDINFDENIDILDIVLQVNIILGILEPTEEQTCAADINEDSHIDILDVVLLVNIILEILPADCYLEPDIGPCDGVCPRYFYNQETEECEMFMWGCCDGVVPFETLEECETSCE